MERLLTNVRSRSLLLFSSYRSLSSFKPNSFDLKSRTLLNLINQINQSKIKSSNIDIISESNNQFPLPGHVGFINETKNFPNENLVKSSIELSSEKISNENELLFKIINKII
jgi:hypothetical protein